MDVLNVLRALLFCVLLCQTSARGVAKRRQIRNTDEARFIGLGGTGNNANGLGTGVGTGLGGLGGNKLSNFGSTWQNLISNVLGGFVLNDFFGKAECQALAEKNLNLVRLANGGVYYLGLESVPWGVADRRCRDLGMHLVCMETKRENDVVLDYIFSRNLYNYDDANSVWIGLVDGDGDTGTSDYNWICNGLPPTYDYWADCCDDLCGTVYYDEDTIAEGVGWDTEACEDSIPYMCELEGDCAKLIPAKNIPYVARK